MRVMLHWKSGHTTETDVREPPLQTLRVPAAMESLVDSRPRGGRGDQRATADFRTFALLRRVVNGEIVCEYHERP